MYAKVDIKHVRETGQVGQFGHFEVRIITPTFDESWPNLSVSAYAYGEFQRYPDAETALEAAAEFYNGAVVMHTALSRGHCDHSALVSRLRVEARKTDSQK